jgi:hypothetical protein
MFVILTATQFARLVTGASGAEACIQGVHDCEQTATTKEGGFDPKNPFVQKKPTRESTTELLQYFSMPCLPIALGITRVNRPPGAEKYLDDLQSAGIISYQKRPATDGDPGHVEFQVELMPGIGPEHFRSFSGMPGIAPKQFGSLSCLKEGVGTSIAITNNLTNYICDT